MSSWAKSVGAKKTNNHRKSRSDKIELRRRVLEVMPEARVLDAFAGSGSMYRNVWCAAASYVACDQRWYPDERLAYVVDNRILLRNIDLQPFNVFDLDAYGSPWEQVAIVCARRKVAPGELIAMVLTDGSRLNLKMGACRLRCGRWLASAQRWRARAFFRMKWSSARSPAQQRRCAVRCCSAGKRAARPAQGCSTTHSSCAAWRGLSDAVVRAAGWGSRQAGRAASPS